MRLKLSLCLTVGLTRLAMAAMTVGELRCEYALNPIGIDTLQPRLSWTLLDDTQLKSVRVFHG